MAKSKSTDQAVNLATEFVPPVLEDGTGIEDAAAAVAGGVPAEIGDRGQDAPATVVLALDLPFFVGEIEPGRHGYISSRIDCTLMGEMGATFRRVLLGCREKHLTYSFNGRMTHVESGSDLVRWLVENLADQMRGLGDAG